MLKSLVLVFSLVIVVEAFFVSSQLVNITNRISNLFQQPAVQDLIKSYGTPAFEQVKAALIQCFENANPGAQADKNTLEEMEKQYKAYCSSTGTEYSIVVHANSLLALSTDGWEITPSNHQHITLNGPVIGWGGLFNVGKTFLLNLIEDWSLPAGILYVTEGISIIKSKLNPAVTHLDTQGSDRLVSPHENSMTSVEDRLANDRFLEEIMLDTSGKVFYVVNTLQVDEIYDINERFERYNRLRAERPREMYIIHNLLNFCLIAEVEKHIYDDIIKAFNATADTESPYIWRSHKDQVVHLVFARENSTAGKQFNPYALGHLRSIVKGNFIGGAATEEEQDLLLTIKNTASRMLEDYFHPPGANRDKVPQPPIGITITPPEGDGSSWFCNWLKSIPIAAQPDVPQEPNYFELKYEQEHGRKVLKLASGMQLHYLPNYGLPYPDAKFQPTWDVVYREDPFFWYVMIDLPGLEGSPRLSCLAKDNNLLKVEGKRKAPNATVSNFLNNRNRRRFGGVVLVLDLPKRLGCKAILENANDAGRVWYMNGVLAISNIQLPEPTTYMNNAGVQITLAPSQVNLDSDTHLF